MDTLTNEQLIDILAAPSYEEMRDRARGYGVFLESGADTWKVDVAPNMASALFNRVEALRDVEGRGKDMTPEEKREAVAAEVQSRYDTAASASTDLGQLAAGDQATSDWMQFLEGGSPTSTLSQQVPFLTDADIQMIFRRSGSDMAALDAYEQQLAYYRQNVDAGFGDPYRVQLEPDAPGQAQARGQLERAYIPGGAPAERVEAMEREINQMRGRAEGDSQYTLSQASNMLYGMTPAEIRTLQRKLQAAGYYETGSGSQGEPLFWGDPTDARTQSAWMNLLGDSVRTGSPVYDMLARRLRTAEESGFDADGNRTSAGDQPDIRLTDSARIRENADQMARDTIGRKFTADEQARLVEFIHGLERDNQTVPTADTEGFAQVPADQVAPDRYTDTADGTNPQREVEDVDVNARIAEYIRRENPVEAEGRDVALTYSDFTGLLAGPGRGGSF